MHLHVVLQVPVHAATPGQSQQLCWSCAKGPFQSALNLSPPIPGGREVLPDVSVQGSSYLGAVILATFKGGKKCYLDMCSFFSPSA